MANKRNKFTFLLCYEYKVFLIESIEIKYLLFKFKFKLNE